MRTERLLLRRWQESDLEPFATMNADPQVMGFFSSTLPRDESDTFVQRIEKNFVENGFGLWAVEAPDGFIGFVGLWPAGHTIEGAESVEIGWCLASRAWGKGYATEAALAARDDGFGRLGLSELVSMTSAINWPSRAVMERIGMQHYPADDFIHPNLPADHRLSPCVMYRMARPGRPPEQPVEISY
ncbi:MAG TPA: N-acetyltransferase [Actinobacteria bacterium]|nr:N-acetyltransferase [Actinomycetota bacterium]